MNMVYTEPELTTEEIAAVRTDVRQYIDKNGMMSIPRLFQGIVMENARLVKENNDLRKMLDIPTRPTYKLSGGK